MHQSIQILEKYNKEEERHRHRLMVRVFMIDGLLKFVKLITTIFI